MRKAKVGGRALIAPGFLVRAEDSNVYDRLYSTPLNVVAQRTDPEYEYAWLLKYPDGRPVTFTLADEYCGVPGGRAKEQGPWFDDLVVVPIR